MNNSNVTAELNRKDHILKVNVNGQCYTFFDSELGNPKNWKGKLTHDGVEYDIQYLLSESLHYLVITPPNNFPFDVKIKVTDNLANDLGNLKPKPHVLGTPVSTYKPNQLFTPKFSVDGYHPHTGKSYRFTESETGEYMVNNIRCAGFPLEIEAEYETVNV